ncbi:MAG TPA: hypothetical protein DIU15_07495, partial [Deltaproteobacteria bacterium]|nr:hypothetical protein [Deltaproteobacteria bacterium]
EKAVAHLIEDGMVAGNGLPDITVNQVSVPSWPQSMVRGTLYSMLTGSNIMVGMADIPFDPEEEGWDCGDIVVDIPQGIYQFPSQLPTIPSQLGTTPCHLLSNYEDENRIGFPPVFTHTSNEGNSSPRDAATAFGHDQYQDWVQGLAESLPDSTLQTNIPHRRGSWPISIPIGQLSWETGNEPDGKRFFWGSAEEYRLKADAIYEGVRAADDRRNRHTPIFYGGFGDSTVFNVGKVEPDVAPDDTDWDAFRKTLRDYRDLSGADEDYGFSFHLFPNPGYGMGEHNIGKYWKVLMEADWESDSIDSIDRIIISAFDPYGQIGNRERQDPEGWKTEVENSSLLTLELAHLMYLIQERNIEAVYFWKLMDLAGAENTSGFFGMPTETSGPLHVRRGYRLLRDVWNVVEDGYMATAMSRDEAAPGLSFENEHQNEDDPSYYDIVEIRGRNGLILRTELNGEAGITWTDDMLVHSCKTNDEINNQRPSGDRIAEVMAKMDWVIYQDVPAGQGEPCPSISANAPNE